MYLRFRIHKSTGKRNEMLIYIIVLNFLKNHINPKILFNVFTAAFGGLDLFGKDVGVTWTKLAATATAGASQIVLAENVSWAVGDEIVIGASHFDAWETEVFKIDAVSGDGFTLTLNASLMYDHIGMQESFVSIDC